MYLQVFKKCSTLMCNFMHIRQTSVKKKWHNKGPAEAQCLLAFTHNAAGYQTNSPNLGFGSKLVPDFKVNTKQTKKNPSVPLQPSGACILHTADGQRSQTTVATRDTFF